MAEASEGGNSWPPIALTVDVEGSLDRVEAETNELLELFSQASVRATFFVLGEVAEARPRTVRAIVERSHEVAFHGYRHNALATLGPAAFAAELREWIPRLEDLAQSPVRGYRAPCFSIAPETAWALRVLARSPIDYDSSLYPGLHPSYGWRGAPTQPVHLVGADLRLFPTPLLSRWLPIGFSGGRWLSTLPPAVVFWGLARQRAAGHAGMVYLHPWQVADQRERVGRLLGKLRTLFRPMSDVLASMSVLPEWDPGLP